MGTGFSPQINSVDHGLIEPSGSAMKVSIGNITIQLFCNADTDLAKLCSDIYGEVLPMQGDISSAMNIYVITGYTLYRYA